MGKRVFYSELAYLLGIITLALGTSFMVKADFGVSMIVAPAYLLHLKISQVLPFFSFGMAEYVLQGFLILLLMLVLRRFRLSYLFSFITAVFYGFMLDFFTIFVDRLPYESIFVGIGYYAFGLLTAVFGVACVFHTYIPPEAYELFVKEISAQFKLPLTKVKIVYDYSSCIIGILLSFCFFGFGHFEGIKAGTIVCALINAFLIAGISKLLEKYFVFRDAFGWRKYFDDKREQNVSA